MTLAELLVPDRVVPELRVADKPHLLAELGRRAATHLGLDADVVTAALAARERLGSTGLGHGFALPHARLDGVQGLFGLFVRLLRPLDYQAIDGQPVDLVFLLLIPPGAHNDHVAALAAIARQMREADTLRDLRRLRTAPALHARLTGTEA